MKLRSGSIRNRACRSAALGLAALLVGGCYEKRIQWAPDSNRAAILTTEGLFLSDANGRLSQMLLPKVKAVAWFSDSQRLAVAVADDSTGGRLAIARIEGEGLTLGPPLYHYRDSTLVDIRIAPGDMHLAFTIKKGDESGPKGLLVAPCDGSFPPAVVSKRAAAYPDWSPEGRALVYFEAAGTSVGEDRLRLGTLVRQDVVNVAGALEIADKPVYLAGVMFSSYARVRSLQDGRVLFNAAEFDLPFASEELGGRREQLFAVDPSRQPTLVRLITRKGEEELPRQLSFFEVSPDERQVLFGTPEGDVHVLTLATGQVGEVQSAAQVREVQSADVTIPEQMQGAPVWREAGQFTYVKRPSANKGRPAEVVLWNGEQEVVLSEEWSSEFIARLVGLPSGS